MYYPYLRGRQQELRAIKALAGELATSSRIVPIVEPVVAKTAELVAAADQVLKSGANLIVVANPKVGDHAGATDVLQGKWAAGLFQHGGLIPAQIIETDTTVSEVQTFSKRYSTRPVCFIHLSTPKAQVAPATSHPVGVTHVYTQGVAAGYVAALVGDRVTLKDKFNRMPKNASYPSDEFFSDDHLTFKGDKLKGFSDYSMIGRAFLPSGGPAHAVAIHIHHEQPDGLWLRHFISDRRTGSADVAGKFAEAVAKLVTFAAKNPKVASTKAFAEFRNHHKTGHFPGLPVVKQLSIRHHIETVAGIL